MTDLNRLEREIPNASISQLREIMKWAIKLDTSSETRDQAGRIKDTAEQRIREQSGRGGDY